MPLLTNCPWIRKPSRYGWTRRVIEEYGSRAPGHHPAVGFIGKIEPSALSLQETKFSSSKRSTIARTARSVRAFAFASKRNRNSVLAKPLFAL